MRIFAVTSGTSIEKVIEHSDQPVFPVIEKGSHQYRGFISYEEVKKYSARTDVSTCGELLKRTDPSGLTRGIYADPHDSPAQALRKIADHELTFLPVVDHQGVYTGTVDLKALSELLESER